jgi:hypothetical protein
LKIALLRAEGLSRAKIAATLGVGEGTVHRMAQPSAKIPIIASESTAFVPVTPSRSNLP